MGFAFVQQATNALSVEFSLPGQKAYETNVRIVGAYHNGGIDPPVVVVLRLPAGVVATFPSVKTQLERVFGNLNRVVPFARVASFANTSNHVFVSANGRTTYGVIYLPPPVGFGSSPGLTAIESYFAHQSINGAPFTVTGIEPLQSGSGSSGGPSVLLEALIGGLGALIVLALVFRSFMALVPLFMAVIAIPTTFVVIWGLTTITQISFIVQFLVALIGLGVAIDYALLIVIRWREEREGGADNDQAVQRAMETAGVSVVFSGTTVAIGLFALVALPVPFLRSVRYGGMLIPLVSVLVAITLLPVVLASIGPRLDWPRSKGTQNSARMWMAWGRLVVKHRVVAAAVALAILAVLVYPVTSIAIGVSRVDSLAKSGTAYLGLKQLEDSGIGAGALTPFELLSPATMTPTVVHSTNSLPGVRGAVAPATSAWIRPIPGTAGAPYGITLVIPHADGSTPAGNAALDHVEHAVAGLGSTVQVGGYSAENRDFVNAVYGNFPLMIALIVIVTFLLLARAFRSVLLPLKAVILNLISVAAAWGVMTFVWQEGYGSKAIWGISPTGSITAWIPLMVFAFLFGLSMDYEVFILSRTREEYDRVGSTDEAITLGIGRTGRLVTSAALILFLAFVSLGTAPLTDIEVLATGLAVGILVDATIIRSLLVPALVSMFGRWNWWLPAPFARVLRTEPSEPVPERDEVAA